VHNIPKTEKDEFIRKIMTEIDQVNVVESQIHIARKWDSRISVFKEMNVQAKILKDMRTQELRRLKNEYKDKDDFKDENEMMDLIMKDDYEPFGIGCCSLTSSSKFKNQLEKFKKACLECEKLESADKGFEIDTFPKEFAYVTFKTELRTSELLDE